MCLTVMLYKNMQTAGRDRKRHFSLSEILALYVRDGCLLNIHFEGDLQGFNNLLCRHALYCEVTGQAIVTTEELDQFKSLWHEKDHSVCEQRQKPFLCEKKNLEKSDSDPDRKVRRTHR